MMLLNASESFDLNEEPSGHQESAVLTPGTTNNQEELDKVSVDDTGGFHDVDLYCNDCFDNVFESTEFHQLIKYMHQNDIVEITSPPTENWATADPCRLRTRFDINTSLERNWEMARDEVREVKSRVLDILAKDNATDVTTKMIVLHFIGPTSNVGKVIKDAANLDDEQYTRFMNAFFIQSAYRISSTQLFASYSLLKEHALISEQEYERIWKVIAYKNQKLGCKIGICRRSESLWETLEFTVNRELRNVSIAERKGKMLIALDDEDKVWYNTIIRWISDTFGIKITRHVKDNRIGMILHTAVSSGLNIPVGCTFERVKESTKECYKRMFGQMFGSYGGIDLRNVNVHSDRGYNLPSIVFDFLVANGANVVGTTKQMSQCWPFTFNQKIKQSDKRTHIDPKGAPTLYMKQATIGPGKKVWSAAFRNGSEAFSTAVSSLHSGFQWEGNTLNHSLVLKYKANPWTLRDMFFASCGQDVGIDLCANDQDDEDVDLVEYYLSQKIDPVTLSQGTADWHYLRKFSLTSSQAHGCFIAAFPFFKHSEAWKSIAQYIYGDNYRNILLKTNSSEVSHGAEVECERNSDNNPMKSMLSFLQEFVPADDNENHALLWLMEYVETDVVVDGDHEEAKNILATITTNERSRTRFINCAISILLNRIPVEKRTKSGQKQLLIWLQLTNAEREYLFMKADALREMLNERGKKCVGNKFSDMIKALTGEPTDTTDSNMESNSISLSSEQLAIKAILEKSFQKPLKGKLRECCSQGHKLEKPILQNWLNLKYDRYFPLPSIEVVNTYVTGLAAKKSRPYAKDSVDFHLHVKETPDSPLVAWGFEAKGRVTVSSEFQEEDYNSNMVRDQHIMIKDYEVNANLASASERFQVLHHAYVYDYGAVMHAVGDAQGEIIQSTIIEFTEHTKRHYNTVVSDLFSHTLAWIYSAERSPVKVPDCFRNIISHVPTINGWDTLQCTSNLWKEMTLQPLPMPPLERIIPSIHAYWNAVKSGSDTTTKLLDSCLVLMPHTTCKSVASTRLIGLILVLIHRLIQLFTAKSEPSVYPSLMHYHDAASKRSTFHHTLLECQKVFSNYIKTKSANPVSEGVSSSIQHPRAIRRKEAGVALQRITNMGNCSILPPHDTPKRLPSKLRNGTAPEQYLLMNESCSGIPMKCFSADDKQYQSRCNYPGCTSKTSWYCHGCKQWLCMEKKKKSNMKDVPHFNLGIKQVQGKQMIFQMTCFHLKHQEVWKPDT